MCHPYTFYIHACKCIIYKSCVILIVALCTDRLLKFLNMEQGSGCGLLLNPDPSKKHRTEVQSGVSFSTHPLPAPLPQVHHTLGELYGRVVVTRAHTSPVTPLPITPPPLTPSPDTPHHITPPPDTPPPVKRAKVGSGEGGRGRQIMVKFRPKRRPTKSADSENDEVFTKFVLRKENLVCVCVCVSLHS